jgi:hypothetical protein
VRLPWTVRNVAMLSLKLLTDASVDFCISSESFHALAALASDDLHQ